MGVKVGEPGERHRESFRTAGLAAARGGVTTMVCRPDTIPPIDGPELFAHARARAAEAAVRVQHMAALTKGRAGREMVEIGFLRDAGAVAFTDGTHVTADTRVLSRCLTYARSLGALVVTHPQEPGLSAGACVTSGKFASLRGLPGVSPLAERMGVERDLALAGATGVALHLDQVTAAAALPALARAKAAGVDVTAGTSIHHLTLNVLDVADYRTFFKLTPPLRDEEDRLAVVEALAAGLIDIVGSFHTPQDEESKRLPFQEAAPGAVGLETLLPAAMRLVHAGHIALPLLWRALSLNPARRLGLPGRHARARGARRPRALRPRRAFRARPLDAGVEVQEHPLRRRPDGGPRARHLGRRRAGLRPGDGVMPELLSGPLPLAAVAVLAYLLGSVPFGIVMARLFGLGDLRAIGSGNIGATNVLRTGNRPAALLTLLGDAGKGGAAVLLARARSERTRRSSRASWPSSGTAFRSSCGSGAARAWRPSSARSSPCRCRSAPPPA